MFELTIESHFSAAHRIRSYPGLCEHLHGHNWKVEVTVTCTGLDELGIAIDFRTLKEKTEGILSELDHTNINELPAFESMNPTCENIARYLFYRLSNIINSDRVRVSRVRVWESPGSSATYYEDEG